MSKILNNLICSAMIFALSFLWAYYCLKSVFWALTVAAVITVCASYLMWRAQSKLYQIKNVKIQNKKAVASLHDYLKFNGNNAELFQELYRYYLYEVTSIDFDSFIAQKDGTTTYVRLFFEDNSLSVKDLQKAIVSAKRNKTDKLCVFCAKVDEAIRKTATAHFTTDFIDIANTYQLLEQSEKLPAIPKCAPSKSSFVAKYAFCKKRFGWYFGSCIFLTLISIVAYFPYYTLGWATVMLALALYSLFNKRYNTRATDVKLN